MQLILVVQYAEISRHDFVLEDSTGWYVDALAVVSYDDDGALQTSSSSPSSSRCHSTGSQQPHHCCPLVNTVQNISLRMLKGNCDSHPKKCPFPWGI